MGKPVSRMGIPRSWRGLRSGTLDFRRPLPRLTVWTGRVHDPRVNKSGPPTAPTADGP